MIETIKITNFQSHKDSVLVLHEGINVLTGPTDNGKTSVVRALNWVVNNEPKGDSFRSNWGGETCVEINMDVGSRVERIKDKGVNLYRITFSGLYEDFKSFGLGVPEEVTEHLEILPINMQFQMDSPFMLSQTPGEVARYLNEIVNLQDIDISVYNLNKISRENNQRLSNLESQLYTQKESLKEYNWIRSADIKLKKVEKLEQEMEDLQERKNRLGQYRAHEEENSLSGRAVIRNCCLEKR
jgi:exonuclease SbcC